MAVGCLSEGTYSTTLFCIPSQQLESGGDFEHLDGMKIYAFVADTTDYTPLNYDDALNGILTNKVDGTTLTSIAEGVEAMSFYSYYYEIEEDDDDDDDDDEEVEHPYEDGEKVVVLLEGLELVIENQEEVMLLAVDTVNEAYAYTNYTLGISIETTYVNISFRPWKSDSFSQGKWWFVIPETGDED